MTAKMTVMNDKDVLGVKGRIFNIQRFSIHDGPGIRTIVFLKGCPLRCRWCCNPESQEWEIQNMTVADKTKTVGRDVTVGEVMETVERDRIYYRRSGGGMTLSGGECTWQPDFSEALLRRAKETGINTAIETTAYAERDVIKRLLPYVDTVLMDIKHIDPVKHKEYTTRDNATILDNAHYIAESSANLIIRVPVVPTFNATESEIRSIAEFAASLPGVTEIHLLPYHRIGSDKYAGLGRDYGMKDIKVPSKELMESLRATAASCGLKAQIGG